MQTYSGSTQTVSANTCPTDNQLRIVLQEAERGRQCESESKLLKSKIDFLYQKIEIKDSIIQIDKLQLQTRANIIEAYKINEGLSNVQIIAYKSEVKALTKQVKKEKIRNGFLTSAVIIGGAALAYVLIK